MRICRTPVGGEFAAKGFGEYGLSQIVNAVLGVFDLLFNLVGIGKKLFDAADNFGFKMYGPFEIGGK